MFYNLYDILSKEQKINDKLFAVKPNYPMAPGSTLYISIDHGKLSFYQTD